MKIPLNSILSTILILICTALSGHAHSHAKPEHVVTLKQAHKGNLEIDTLLLDSYGRLPENERTFYLESRRHLAGSASARLTNQQIIAAAQKAGLPLISGPMLGHLTESAITVWFRPLYSGVITVQLSDAQGGQRQYSVKATTPGAAMRVRLDRLAPDTSYTYQLIGPSDQVLGQGSFKTAPEPGSKAKFRIAFGSCYHKIGIHNPNLMQLITRRGNHAMLLIGDIAVDDREARFNMHYADYLLRDVSRAWRDFAAHIPIYASWDDHDYLNNDKSGLQKGQISKAERRTMRSLWQDNWNNPPTNVSDRGIYFSTVVGNVEIIMLDTRSCRVWDKRDQRGSYLGEAQSAWLLETLKASKAPFIILTSGTMWSDYMSNAKDSWGTWDQPVREEIFSLIEAHDIAGVILLSGDRHGARGFRIGRPSGFELYEFEAASLGADSGPRAMAPDTSMQIFGYPAGILAFGELTFDTTLNEPVVTFRLINEVGEVLEEHLLDYSRLTPSKTQP
ncbi:MAG: alkaline phosphatase D family protein [Verrucomicrobiota bacterium]